MFVDLTSVVRHPTAADTIANALDLEERGGDTNGRLIAALESREMLPHAERDVEDIHDATCWLLGHAVVPDQAVDPLDFTGWSVVSRRNKRRFKQP